jgi:alpha-tubulin suppressor-like RCC1 family protein
VVVSKSVGRAVVRASSGGLSGSADLLVRQVLASLRLNAPASGLLERDTLRVSAEGADSNGVAMSVTGVTWSSSRTDVALVENGLVSGVRFGETEVTAASGAVTARRRLYVVAPSGRIGGGYIHTCALDGSGRALCWGWSDMGQVGNGTIGAVWHLTPQVVSGDRTYTSISVSERFACALTAAGEAYCWGRNWEGQVGDGTTTHRAVPTLVQGGIAFKSITVGERHACGLDAAGYAYCWGEGLYGALGNGSTAPLSTPTRVLGGLTFRSLASGSFHVCGIATDGLTYCWGYAYWGATGRGTGSSQQTVPMPVASNQRFVQLASGYMLTCGLTAERSVYCWGQFYYPFGTTPPPMGVPTMHPGRFVGVSVGYSHACAYTVEMKLHCWGANRSGDLGIGRDAVSGDEGDVLSDKTFVSAGTGQEHTCAITSGGEAYCWGAATAGRLGDGTETSRNAPGAPVAATTSFR